MTTKARLKLIEGRLRPGGCYSGGGVCERVTVVGDETPNDPDLPKRCPNCGRPRTYQIVRIGGIDARLL